MADVGRGLGGVVFQPIAGIVEIALVFCVIADVVGFFLWPYLAFICFGYITIAILLETLPLLKPISNIDKEGTSPLFKIGFAALVISIVWTVIADSIIGMTDWVNFRTAALITIILFTIKVIFYLLSRDIFGFKGLINILFSASLWLSVFVFPPPPESPEGHEADRREKEITTEITVNVKDERSNGLEFMDVTLQWQNGQEPDSITIGDDKFNNSKTEFTDSSGQVRFYYDYSFDPKEKKAVVDVVPAPDDNLMPEHIELTGITRGEKKEVTVLLKKKVRSANDRKSGKTANITFKPFSAQTIAVTNISFFI